MQDEIQQVNNNIESIYQNMKHDQSGQNDSNDKCKGQREGHSANNSASSQRQSKTPLENRYNSRETLQNIYMPENRYENMYDQ